MQDFKRCVHLEHSSTIRPKEAKAPQMYAYDHVCKNWLYMVRVTLFPVQRYKIRDVELLRRILNFIDDSVGSTISAKRIADYFRSQARSVDMNTVYPYLDALASSFLITRVQRYDIQGKKLLKTQEKYYLADTGLQHAVFGYRDRHIFGILENIVYNELIRRGYTVYIGKLGTQKIDCIAEQ